MDNLNLNTPSSPSSGSVFELGFDEAAKSNLRSTASIAGIAAIAIIISAGLGVVNFFLERSKQLPPEFEGYENVRRTTDVMSIIYLLISLAINFLFFFFLNKFSSQAKTGLSTSNSSTVSESIGNLANYFKTVGIVLIVLLCLTLLILFALLAGTAVSR